MSFGLTTEGFKAKRLADIAVETTSDFEAKFGAAFELDPRTPEGLIKGILDERIAKIWELAESIYASQSPANAEGVQLDLIVALNGIARKPATKSTVSSGRARGTLSTVIPLGTLISVEGNIESQFATDAAATIDQAGINEVQRVAFDDVPDSGDFKLVFGSETTVVIAFGATAAAVEAALENLSNIGVGNVSVTGDFPKNEIQRAAFSGTPISGSFKFVFGVDISAAILFSANAAAVEAALEAMPSIGVGNVSVSGTYATDFVITFIGALKFTDLALLTTTGNNLSDGGAVSIIVSTDQEGIPGFDIEFQTDLGDQDIADQVTFTDNNLLIGATPIVITPSTVTDGDEPKSGLVPLTAVNTGAKEALAGTLNVIDTPVIGMDSFTNETDAVIGREKESDADLKARRDQELATAGAATPDAIRAKILELDDITAVIVFFNNKDVIDSDGRPPHSVDVVVQGGDEQEIADNLFATIAAGIGSEGTILKEVVDSNGFIQEVNFSRPTEVPIAFEIDIVKDDNFYPSNGDEQVADAILAFGLTYLIGQSVVVFGSNGISCAVQDIPGITDMEIRISIDPAPPVTDDNIPIAAREIADFDSSRIAVVST